MTRDTAPSFINDAIDESQKPHHRKKTLTEKLLEYREIIEESPSICEKICMKIEDYFVPDSLLTSVYSAAPGGRWVFVYDAY